jgi:hypothetical protein
VHLHAAREAACQHRRHERLELALAGPAREPAGDEQRLALERHADPLELLHRRRQRGPPRIPRHAWHRQGRRLDHDRHAAAARDELFERRPVEREPQRLLNRGSRVRDGLARRSRAEHDRVLGHVHDLQSRAGEQRDPHYSRSEYPRA